jgi:hypothetical protein
MKNILAKSGGFTPKSQEVRRRIANAIPEGDNLIFREKMIALFIIALVKSVFFHFIRECFSWN